MQLSQRLSEIADMVSPGNRMADIGTDHGYIPVWLLEEKRMKSALAMDVKPGPLSRARKTIHQHNLEKCIETRLSDGLEQLKPGEVDSIVIAGMGGALMIRILKQGEETVRQLKEMILQPQSEIEHVRSYLQKQHYCIVEERMIREDGKYYSMMKAVSGGQQNWNPTELEFGKCLLAEKNPCLKDFLDNEIRQLKEIQKVLMQQTTDRARQRKKEVEVRIDQLNKIQEDYYGTGNITAETGAGISC